MENWVLRFLFVWTLKNRGKKEDERERMKIPQQVSSEDMEVSRGWAESTASIELARISK